MTTQKQFSSLMSTFSIISAILVVYIHTYNIDVYSNVSSTSVFWIEEAISHCLARGAVPFFFMSSAFFLYSGKKTVSETYKSRFKSTVIPYLIWNTIYMILFTILHHLSFTKVGMDEINFENILSGIFLNKYHYAFWFMKALIIYVILYPILYKIISYSRKLAIIIGILYSMSYYIFSETLDNAILFSFIYYYIGAFCGYYYKEQIQNLVLLHKKKKVFTFLILTVLAIASFFAVNVYGLNITFLRNIIIVMLVFSILNCINIKTSIPLSTLSFMIYSQHPFILEIVEKTIYVILPHTTFLMFASYIFSPVICLCIIVIICNLWKKISPSSYKLLNGGRI